MTPDNAAATLARQLAVLKADLDAVRLRGGKPPKGRPSAFARCLGHDLVLLSTGLRQRRWSEADIERVLAIYSAAMIGPARPAREADPDHAWIDGRWKRVPTEERTT